MLCDPSGIGACGGSGIPGLALRLAPATVYDRFAVTARDDAGGIADGSRGSQTRGLRGRQRLDRGAVADQLLGSWEIRSPVLDDRALPGMEGA